ncbi:MAG: hypothetical protein KGH79_02770 [Patescibacteria group bacterium]|nr:hypothetical protein [Patescibacteria group bacterium]
MEEKEAPKKKFYTRWWFWAIVVVVVLIVIGSSGSSSSGTPSYQSSQGICDTDPQALSKEAFVPNYKQLDKDPSASQGTIATFTGQIVQIQQSGDEGIMRLSVTKESYGWSSSDIVYVTYHKATTAVEGDVVSVTGMLTGTETYTSQANFQITIPSIDVCMVDTKPAPPAQTATPKPKATTPTPAPSTSQSSTPAPVAQTPPPVPASWHTVATFSGSGNKNTDTFTIKGSQWRIQWSATADSSDSFCSQNGCTFSAQIVKPGDNFPTDYVQSSVYTTKSDSSNFYTTGTFYLKLNTYLINSWTVTVEDYY